MWPGPSAVRVLAARSVYEAGTLVGRYPKVALTIAKWRGHGQPVTPSTDVVIEGYPRSANSLMVATFAAAQPRPVRIAHHVHAPGQVIEAVRLGIPALVLVREPEEAVVEFVLLKPALTVGLALRGWLRFYAPLGPHRAGFVTARTAEVSSDPAAPIRRMNERFGTAFALPADTEESREAAQRAIGDYWEGRSGPGLPILGRTSGTERDRDADRERLRREYLSVRHSRARLRAERLFGSLAGASS